MSRFVELTTQEFADLLAQTKLTRRIDVVHLHHTWRPNHAQWRGEDSVEGMWRYHVKTNGWSDIAQHVTIAPDGGIWTGRSWNQAPASAKGFNGNAVVGPFMIEVVGDFDVGKDSLAGAQLVATVDVVARVQQKFGLAPEALRFHREMTDQKSCPGTGVDRQAILAAVRQAHAAPAPATSAPTGAWAKPAYRSTASPVATAARLVVRAPDAGAEVADAEPAESTMSDEEVAIVTGITNGTRSAPRATGERDASRAALTPAMLAALRPHVVNLNEGGFSGSGIFRTEPGDVDRIFADLRRTAQAKPKEPLRVVLWAHGGLIDEARGLWIAHQQCRWWKDNGVYPIFFVWETGFLDALRQILGGTRAAARDLGDLKDAFVAKTARALGGGKIWSAMKRSAELAVAPSGAARYVAEHLGRLVQEHAHVELHAVGHSAGSIFHAHFLPTALGSGVSRFASLQLLAPAIRCDLFAQQLLGRVGPGHGIDELVMFTMARDWEEADSVAIYARSLLYLIRDALEPEEGAEILGLEECVRRDSQLARLFGLDGLPSPAEVVWSVTDETSGRTASTSATHGGFDNDRATMDAVAWNVLGAQPSESFPDEAIERGFAAWQLSTSLPASSMPLAAVSTNGASAVAAAQALPSNPLTPVLAAHPGAGNRRVALCIGIDAYATQPLGGCVADATHWKSALQGLGFTCSTLFDQQARRSAMIDAMHDLITTSRPGDVVVLQYAGHGTHLDDLDDDELDGQDEALCPVDLDEGAYLIDDDIAMIMAGIPDGVNVTCFFDCCHSGTNTRFAVGPVPGTGARGASRARFIRPTDEMQRRHKAFRSRQVNSGAVPGRSESSMRNVVFAACQDSEVAWESGGRGEFSVRALEILGGGIGFTHEQLEQRIRTAFGPSPRQLPRLDCAPEMRARMLLMPFDGRAYASTSSAGRNGTSPDLAHVLAESLRGVADMLGPR